MDKIQERYAARMRRVLAQRELTQHCGVPTVIATLVASYLPREEEWDHSSSSLNIE